MTHLIRESSPISVNIFFCFSVQSFLFLQKCPWLLPTMIHYLWLIKRFPAMVSPQVPDCCLCSSNQPIRELIEWDWHYPIKIHYSTRLVDNPKFALNTAPHQTQLFRQNNGPIKILNEWQAFHSIFWLVEWFIQWEELKAFFSSSSLSFTVQSLSIPTGAIRLIHIWAIQWVIFITQSLTH